MGCIHHLIKSIPNLANQTKPGKPIQTKIWKPIAFASHFLNTLESRYSTNELELLAVVSSIEHFKYYIYCTEFIQQTDHQALLTALKENRGNKTYQS